MGLSSMILLGGGGGGNTDGQTDKHKLILQPKIIF
jgi:hypothetical protein